MRRRLLLASAAMASSIAACHATLRSLELTERNRRLDARVGDTIAITLQTVGPGAFADPPEISVSVVRFVDVGQVMPPVPAGPTQRFRFIAEARGTAIITFHNAELASYFPESATVKDTIVVH